MADGQQRRNDVASDEPVSVLGGAQAFVRALTHELVGVECVDGCRQGFLPPQQREGGLDGFGLDER